MTIKNIFRYLSFYNNMKMVKWTNKNILVPSVQIQKETQRSYSEVYHQFAKLKVPELRFGLHTKIRECENRLEVQASRWPSVLNLSYIWLRDHCRCPKCYSADTFQRVKDVYGIPVNIRPVAVSSTDEELHVEWPDGHTSKFDFKFLWENTYEGRMTSVNVMKPVTWTKYSFPKAEQYEVSFSDFKANKNGQRKLVEALLKYGVGVVVQVSPTVEATREVVEELCQVRRTFFGEMWAFQSNLEHADSAYSTEYLGPHTDTTYFTEASRIQVFHCLKVANKGGETLLVDGFHVGEQLRKQDPECYDFLSSTVFPSEYIEDNQHHLCEDSIFKHHPVSKKLMQFRYNIYDRAPLSSLPFNKIQEYYSHLHKLTALVRDEVNEVELLLKPGGILFIDNWRVMHGRKSYEGPRIMGGCYLENGDFVSKARTLGLLPQ